MTRLFGAASRIPADLVRLDQEEGGGGKAIVLCVVGVRTPLHFGTAHSVLLRMDWRGVVENKGIY